jgi:Ca2+-binding RTX toxin-like protein
MRTSRFRRTLALLAGAALLAGLAAATVAAPASAAKPRCAGKVATIVGTAKGEVIRGTQKADVIVAKGGNDIVYGRGGNDTICGGPGNDRILGAGGNDLLLGQGRRDKLYGGPGRDRLLGGPANDRLAGGPGNDACLQGSGTGPRLSCERPVPPVVVPPPPPPPPTLVVAYADANRNHLYDAGDVMIAEIVDTNGTGSVDPGDTINMGQYPTTPLAVTPAAIRQTFEDWRVKSHVIATVLSLDAYNVGVTTTGGGTHYWYKDGTGDDDEYLEFNAFSSDLFDNELPGGNDIVGLDPRSPSQPTSEIYLTGHGTGDDGVVEIDIY